MHLERSSSTGEEDQLENSHDTTTLRQLAPEWRCRVLIVDDDEIVRAHLSALLKRSQFEVHLAASAEEALRILETVHCQIVLTDWQMPGMDGLALCRKVRLQQADGYVYIMMLTVREGKQDMLLSLAAGADDYIVKGSSIEEIIARMEVARRITHLEFSLRSSNRENRRLSVTDPLTGAHNRRYLMKYLPRELARAKRYVRPLAVLCCDIDRFKKVNDRLGHAAGDHVLQEFVLRVTRCLRDTSDWLARSGGDEFVIVMPETSAKGAECVAQKVRRILEDSPLLVAERSIRMTVSIGVTALGTARELSNTSAADLLRAADMKLYANKRRHKDLLLAAENSSAPAAPGPDTTI